jgi:hypothetical protein
MTSNQTFTAVYSHGHLEPVDAKLDLREKETVQVTVQRDPRAVLTHLSWDATGLDTIRARFGHLPRLNLDETIAADREERA